MPDAPPSRLSRLLAALLADLVLAGALAAILLLVRSGLLCALRDRLDPGTGAGSVLLSLLQGVRFDLQASLVMAVPCLLASLFLAWRGGERLRHGLRLAILAAAGTASLLAGIADLFYFREFSNQFDHHLLEPLHEDLGALAATVWHGYPVLWVLLGTGLVAGLLALAGRRLLPREGTLAPRLAGWRPGGRIALAAACLVALVLFGRGSLWGRPLQKGTAGLTSDPVLNRLVPTPWHCVRAAILEYRALQAEQGLAALLGGNQDPSAAAALLFGERAATGDLDACVERRAAGSATAARHVVLVVLEGQSGFALFERHRRLGLAPGLAGLGAEGLYLERFLPASGGTIYSLGAIFSGVPDCGLVPSLVRNARQAYPTAVAGIFRRLGYRTRFLYGGHLESKRYGAFAQEQGFEEIRGINDVQGRNFSWGADDRDLFAYVARVLDDRQPTFTVILTTTNHPPFEADLAGAGCDLPGLAAALPGLDAAQLRAVAHLWYNDHCLTAFARTAAQRLPRLLLAITGDHPSRRWVETQPPVPDRSAVPCILWGPEVLPPQVPQGFGDHLDLIPTLVERCAPAGFAYHAWGRDLLLPAPPEAFASGAWTALDADSWVDLSLPPEQQGADPQAWARLLARFQAKHGLGWWRQMKGAALVPGR